MGLPIGKALPKSYVRICFPESIVSNFSVCVYALPTSTLADARLWIAPDRSVFIQSPDNPHVVFSSKTSMSSGSFLRQLDCRYTDKQLVSALRSFRLLTVSQAKQLLEYQNRLEEANRLDEAKADVVDVLSKFGIELSKAQAAKIEKALKSKPTP